MKFPMRFLIILIPIFFSVVFTSSSLMADGTELVVAKRNILGIIDEPPSISPGEYVKSGTFSNGRGTFRIQTYRSMDGSIEEIQIYLNIIDTSIHDDQDEVRIYFDVDHNHVRSDDDRGIRIYRALTTGDNNIRITNVNLTGDPTDLGNLPTTPTTPQWSVESTLSGWTSEVKIRAENLGLNFIPSIMGMHIRVFTVDGVSGDYPESVYPWQIASWANLKTRYPLEYVLLLDQSGSMNKSIDSLGTRWEAAKSASDIFVQLMHAIRSPYFDDKIGLRTYYWEAECIYGWWMYVMGEYGFMDAIWFCFQDVIGDYVSEEKPLGSLNAISVDGYTDSSPPLSNPRRDWRTPIKRGLDSAFETLDGGDSEKVILLLTDGFHNMPSQDYDEEPYHLLIGIGLDDFQVNTVALGPDESVGTELLDNIKDEFLGFGGSYTSALNKKQLIDTFVENIFPYFYLNRTDVSSSGHFDVNSNESRLVVMLVWHSTSATERGFRLKKPNGDIIDRDDSGYHHYKHPTLPYEIAYYVIDDPSPEGAWQTIKLDSETAEVGDNAFAIFDPTVYAYFSVVQDEEDFILKAVLKENGQAISEAGAEVLVDVDRPVEGLGTYASTAQPDCSFAEPHFPRKKASSMRLLGGKVAKEKLTSISYDKAQQGPVPNYIAKVKELFRICGEDRLDREGETSLRLYDDATHGDSVAGDGIFTYRYTDTQYEGTYTFKFTASGTAPSGSTFSRIRTLSAHKSINVTSGNTDSDFVDRGYAELLRTVEVYTIPRDLHKEYLGPGHKVQFKTTAGNFTSQIKDHINGIYSQILQYDESKDRPVVSVIVNEKELEKIRVFKAFEIIPFVGYFFFDNLLNLYDGVVVGGRFGYRFTNRLTFELEGGVTFTEDTVGENGNIIQAMANIRYDILPLRIRRWAPYITVGAGYVFARGFGTDDESFAFQGGAGSTYRISNSFGARIDAKVFRINKLFGSGNTTNYQVTGGLVFWF